MSQPVVYEYATRQRKNLGFVLQTAERRREDEAVIIALEFGTVIFTGLVQFFHAEAFV